MRFALKCLPAGAAARVLAGELLRLPASPTADRAGVGGASLRELPEILRLRADRARPETHFDWLLAGMPE